MQISPQPGVPGIPDSLLPSRKIQSTTLYMPGGFYLETRYVKNMAEGNVDVTRHLFTRALRGRCVIIADRPIVFLSVLRKQWKKHIKLLYMERARTLDHRKAAIQQVLDHLEVTTFSVYATDANAGVVVVPPQEAQSMAGAYNTLYICANVSQAQKMALCSGLPKGALVVEYTLYAKPSQELCTVHCS